MWRDEGWLLDILTAARKIVQYASGVTREEFSGNELLQDGIIRQCAVIGEAARMISQETRDRHPKIPWKEIIGMRHKLVHEYFRIDLAKVWDAVQEDVPELVRLIEPLVPPEETEG